MNSISINYTLKWRFVDYPHIQISTCKKIFNTQTGRLKKICYNGGSVGIWITPKRFIVKSNLNKYIEKIPKFQNKVGCYDYLTYI